MEGSCHFAVQTCEGVVAVGVEAVGVVAVGVEAVGVVVQPHALFN